MAKKTIAKEKIYKSLEQWKNDFLPQTVESEHLQLKSASDENRNTDNVRPEEAVNLMSLST